MKANLRAQGAMATARYAGTLHFLLETLVFTCWKEVNGKKIPIPVQNLLLHSNNHHKIEAMNCR